MLVEWVYKGGLEVVHARGMGRSYMSMELNYQLVNGDRDDFGMMIQRLKM